jgi:hypothetical protein
MKIVFRASLPDFPKMFVPSYLLNNLLSSIFSKPSSEKTDIQNKGE